MKLFKKLMAGAMAIAMLSAYTVAFAAGGSVNGGAVATTSGSDATATGVGLYAGGSKAVFLMKLPTAAANDLLAFTVDPDQILNSSQPTDTAAGSTFGTVVFKTVSGATATYKNESAPLTVTSMSSVDVTVNMFATLSDTKMKLSATSGFTSASTEHLYLGVKVSTASGTTTEAVTGLGAKKATVLQTVATNFKTTVTSGGITTARSGGLTDDDASWKSADYTVVGASNPNADWKIAGISAPTLTIKWMVDAASDITYPLTTPTGSSYTAKLDKDAYKVGDTVTLYVKPNSDEAAFTSATLTYIALGSDGKMNAEKTASFRVNNTKVNGVYSATLTLPSDMALSNSPVGDATYAAPTWEIEVG